MENEKFERQDFINGFALAGVLLFLLILVLVGAWSCSSSLGSVSQGEKTVVETTTTVFEEVAPEEVEEVEEVAPAKEPGDVLVRVGNGANISGLATSGTRLLSQNSYDMLQGQTKKGEVVEQGTVYFIEGYEADAFLVAELLVISSQQVEPLPDQDIGVDVDTAHIVVILGEDAEF